MQVIRKFMITQKIFLYIVGRIFINDLLNMKIYRVELDVKQTEKKKNDIETSNVIR